MTEDDKPAFVIEEVPNLARATGALAIALIWENPPRVVIDAKLRARPRKFAFVLWHEGWHVRFKLRHGMSRKCGVLNLLWNNCILFQLFYWRVRYWRGRPLGRA